MNKEDLIKYKEKLAKLSEEEKKLRDIYLKQIADGTLQGPQTGYSSIDKEWQQFYSNEDLLKSIPQKSMFQFLIDSAKDNMDRIAVDLRMGFNNFEKSIRKMTYRDFIEESVTIACGLKELGIGMEKDELLLHMLPNLIESRETIYSSNANGTVVYPLSPMVPTSKLNEIITKNNAKSIVMFGGFYEKFKEQLNNDNIKNIIFVNGLESFNPIMKKIIKLTDKEGKYKIPNDDRIITWDKVIKEGKKYRKRNKIKKYSDFSVFYDKEHIAVVVGTSGTTGVTKGACLSDNAINAMAFSNGEFNDFKAGETNLDALIQSISYGIGIMHLSMTSGLNNILIPEMVTDKISKLLKKFPPEHFCGGPIHYENILKSEEFQKGELPNPKYYLSGGASLSKETEKKLNGGIDENYIEQKTEKSKVFVRQGLGSTENIGTGVFTAKGAYKFGSVGIPIGFSNCSIFKKGTDEEVMTGEIGEICMTGPTLMKEYLNNSEETNKVLIKHSDGTVWLHLGDQGYMDKDGHVYMIDRYKNIFMRNGFNVHPSKIQETLMSSNYLEDCFVMGVEHPIEMCVPVAFVISKQGIDQELLKEKLDQLCYEKLDEYYVPYEYKFVKEIPHNLGGKVDSKKLIELYNIDYSNEIESKTNLR